MKYFIYLALAICLEVFGSTMLKLSEGFTVLYPSIGVVLGFLLSFVFLGLSLNGLPLSTAYAIWAGLGTAFTALIGIIVFHEAVDLVKIIALLLIIVGVVMLNNAKGDEAKKQVESAIN